MKKVSLLFVFCLILTMSGKAQLQKEDQSISWFTYSGNHKLTNKLSCHTLVSVRRSDFAANWQQSLVRLGLNYSIDDNFVITAGLDWAETYPYGKQPIAFQTTEYRPFEQLVLKNKSGRINISHRFRLEQRFIEHTEEFDFRNRVRYRFTVNIPVNHMKMENNTLYFIAFDELFTNFGQHIGAHYFDQNWAFIGFGYKFNTLFQVSAGCMNQYILKSDNQHVENNHTLSLGITYNLNFAKKQ